MYISRTFHVNFTYNPFITFPSLQNDGTLAMHDIEEKLVDYGLSRSLKRDISRAADKNRDGYLTYDEYRHYVSAGGGEEGVLVWSVGVGVVVRVLV